MLFEWPQYRFSADRVPYQSHTSPQACPSTEDCLLEFVFWNVANHFHILSGLYLVFVKLRNQRLAVSTCVLLSDRQKRFPCGDFLVCTIPFFKGS